MKIFNIESLPPRIPIGQQTETGVLFVGFNCAEWLRAWPSLVLSVWAKRPGETVAYPAVSHMEGDVLVWAVSNADTALAGWGSVEIMGTAEGLKKLSTVTGTHIRATMTNTTTEPPEPSKPWVDAVLDAAKRAEEAAERAENAGGGSGGGITQETDPTVPAWAKAEQKPTYTAEEVGAASKEEVDKLSEEIVEQGENIAPVMAVKELFEDAVIIREQANIFPPEYVRSSRYDYNTGKVYNPSSTAIRNANPVPVSGDTQYSWQEFVNPKLTTSFFFYDAAGNKIGEHFQAAGFVHFTTPADAVNMNFHIATWETKNPNDEPQVMIWQTDSETTQSSFIPYGQEAAVKGVEFPKLIVQRTEEDKEKLSDLMMARFDESFNYIAYSKIADDGGAINTAEHFIHCAKKHFTALKGDVRPTSDGKLIMCHDAGFTLREDGRITTFNADNAVLIRDMTAEACVALQHDNENHVIDFEQYIKICKKYGKFAYITVRDEYLDDVITAMFSVLKKYSMRDRCIINSLAYETLQAIRQADPDIVLCYTAYSTVNLSNTFVDRAKALGNCIACGFDFPNLGGFDEISKDVLSYAHDNGVRVYEAQVNDPAQIDQLMDYGIMGAQMTVEPVL